jgi:hypothetical protein
MERIKGRVIRECRYRAFLEVLTGSGKLLTVSLTLIEPRIEDVFV